MGKVDIRAHKQELRTKYRSIRENMEKEEKSQKDDLIFRRVVESEHYQKAHTLICFVSTPIEIDTHRLIHHAWRHHKRVAVPKCLSHTGEMAFYYINSMDDLKKDYFSLWEPDPESCEKFVDYEGSICVVPGFSFDSAGYRLGYGKGYYDRFLSKYSEIKIGICYNSCIAPNLPHGRYDVPVNYLFTEKYVKKI